MVKLWYGTDKIPRIMCAEIELLHLQGLDECSPERLAGILRISVDSFYRRHLHINREHNPTYWRDDTPSAVQRFLKRNQAGCLEMMIDSWVDNGGDRDALYKRNVRFVQSMPPGAAVHILWPGTTYADIGMGPFTQRGLIKVRKPPRRRVPLLLVAPPPPVKWRHRTTLMRRLMTKGGMAA